MTGHTTDHNIRYPQMTDRANISVVQGMAEDTEREILSVRETLRAGALGTATWTRLPWNKSTVMSGMTVGNALVVANAFQLGKLVWIDLYISAPQPGTTPTTKWSTGANNINLPVKCAINTAVWGMHYPGVGSGTFRYLAVNTGYNMSIATVQGLLMGANTAYPSIPCVAALDLAVNTGRAAGSVWGNSGFFSVRMMYRSF